MALGTVKDLSLLSHTHFYFIRVGLGKIEWINTCVIVKCCFIPSILAQRHESGSTIPFSHLNQEYLQHS